MSFPGYLKSLKLRNNSNNESESELRDQAGRSSTRATNYASGGSNTDSGRTGNNLVQPDVGEVIEDERGNGPKKSLWVGNIPPRTTSTELRELFRQFGKIESTKPHAKYAFVNFETLDSAIAAFKKYHDKDIFKTGNSTVNIRFTTNIAEAKQAKGDVREHRSSISTKAEAAQKHWFQSVIPTSDEPTTKTADTESWPNGKPPTGPKSQRLEISPPPLRRGDSYRPTELTRTDNYRLDEYRRSSKDDYRRGRGSHRRRDQHYSPTYSPSHSRSPSGSESSTESPGRHRDRDDESPLPWERKKSDAQSPRSTWKKSLEEIHQSRYSSNISYNSTVAAEGQHETNQNHDMDTQSHQHADAERKMNNIDYDDFDHSESAYSPILEPRGGFSSLVPVNQSLQPSRSPSLWPVERLRVENENHRASSVPSEVTTSSTKTSSKERRCYDCKKAGSDLSPLVPCSQCRRRFHSGCGDPKPSFCLEKSDFVCGGCLHDRRTKTSSAHATSELAPPQQLKDKAHLVSPPLSLNYSGVDSTNPSPRNDLSHIFADERGLESFFERQPAAANDQAYSELVQPSARLQESVHASSLPRNQPSHQQSVSTRPGSSIAQADDQSTSKLMNRYKSVTCKWWASGSCTQSEEGCYYSHSRTAISLPDRKRVNKHWTCFDWLQSSCVLLEQDCLHAHQDTGLHIWRDGRPSLKHVTCFWWLKGRCKWDQESCKLAHKDTGLYSLDPSETWQGGAKFSTVRPVDGPARPALHRRSTAYSASSVPLQPEGEVAPRMSRMTDNPAESSINDTNNSATMKPALTINTSTQLPVIGHSDFLTRSKSFLDTIGAPPQTPNEDSPDKVNARVLEASGTKFHFQRRVPDLPTPGLEDTSTFENGPSDYIGAGLHKTVENNQGKAGIQWQTAETNKEVPVDQSLVHDAALKRLMHSGSFKDDRSSHPVLEITDKLKSDVSRDPRLQRQGKVLEQTVTANSDRSGLISPKVESSAEEQAATTLSKDSIACPSDDNSRRGVRKCQNCHKTVFASDLCRICSSNKDASNSIVSPDQSEIPDTTSPVLRKEAQVVSPAAEVLVKDLCSAGVSATTVSELKNSLKRSASGSNMFLKNKRPKSSMMFSSSGSIRPDAFRREPSGQRPHASAANLELRREAQPTLDDLIIEERLKNHKKNSDSVLDQTSIHTSIDGYEKENVRGNNLSRRSDAPIRPMGPATGDKHIISAIPTIEPPTAEIRDLFSSPHSSHEAKANCNQQKSCQTDGHSRPSVSPQRPSREISQWRISESPQPQVDDTESPTSRETTTRQNTSSRTSVASEASTETEIRKQKTPLLLRRISSRDIVISPEKFSWASPITCTQCQKHHKKCLHDERGTLSAVKCRDYVLSRKGKPDTGRSRFEWNAIVKAGELDPESDDESSQDEGPRTGVEEVCSSESEDDFLTAIGGDEVMNESVSSEGEAFLEKFKKPSPKVTQPITTKSTSPTVARFFTSPRNTWSKGLDKSHQLHELKKKGVMFESESEDEDYLSDNHEAPVQRTRNNDPLFVPPKVSRDLFEIAPYLNHELLEFHETKVQNRPPRPSRKEQWATLRSRQLQERREQFGNPHWEIDRIRTDVTVTTLIERIVPPKDPDDRFAVGAVQTREEKISFSDFLGVPKLPEICLMADGERLGFRDGQKERDRTFGRTGRGLGKRDTDEEKWPVRQK